MARFLRDDAMFVEDTGSAPQSYSFTQATPAMTWIINHNLGARPNVTLWDTGGTVIDAEVINASMNQVIVYFAVPVAGSGRCTL